MTVQSKNIIMAMQAIMKSETKTLIFFATLLYIPHFESIKVKATDTKSVIHSSLHEM